MEKKYIGIPQVVIETDDIQHLSQKACEQLKCGDVVVKLTISEGKKLYHTYQVSHKQATGLCFTYADASCVETVSYDKIDGVWTYNSTDVWRAQ